MLTLKCAWYITYPRTDNVEITTFQMDKYTDQVKISKTYVHPSHIQCFICHLLSDETPDFRTQFSFLLIQCV